LVALERTASALESELATWRRRSLKAEGDLEEAARRVPDVTTADVALLNQRIGELETENQRLRDRIGTAREQVEQLKTRLRFVEEHVAGELG
jgi:chromosome segregation ATPase